MAQTKKGNGGQRANSRKRQQETGGIQGELLLLGKTKEKQNPWIRQSEMKFF